jgi:7-carboxy-7-deazaguanine synthase
MHIIEIYKSLQGESSFAGLPCIFVRLAGCNLRCAWCDSEYTFAGGSKMTATAILTEVQRLSPTGGLIEITGGEPMLQERELIPFIRQLLHLNYQLLLETSGERPLESVPRDVHKIVDVKCPGSGEHLRFRLENLATLTAIDELKFVLASRQDYEYAREFIREHELESIQADSRPALILSPAFRKDATGPRAAENCLLNPGDLAQWMLADDLQARLGLQIHKFIWQPQLKGV